MELIGKLKIYRFMAKSKLFASISLLLIISSIYLLATKGLNFGVDFVGGTIIQIKYVGEAPINKIRDLIETNEILAGGSVTEFGSSDEVVIRIRNSVSDLKNDLGDTVRETLKNSGEFEIRRVDMVGAKVGSELREKGISSLLFVFIAILIYVSIRFEWRFALASIIALFHDLIIALGFLSFFSVEVNLDALAAMLTLLGYSINDTIIVFDRIREGLVKYKGLALAPIVDEAVSRTLSRTTLTSLLTWFVVATLFFFGGEIIYGFSFVLFIGIIVGTYSSIFIASPIVIWLKFSVEGYRKALAEKEKREKEQQEMREMYGSPL
jgi:preprotein translocase subunit SecF